MRSPKILIFYVLVAMMLATTSALAAGEWMPGLSTAGWVAVLGLMAGTALAYSNFPGWTAHLTSTMYGLFVLGLTAGLNPALIDQKLGWRERILEMVRRINEVIITAMNGGLTREQLHFFLIVCGVTWVFAYTSAWYTYRHRRPWHVILPTGFVLFCSVYYYGGQNWMEPYLAVFLLGVIVLLVHSFISEREEQWQDAHMRYASNLRSTLSYASLALGALVIITAWQLPDFIETRSGKQILQTLNQPYNEIQQRAGRLFGGITNYNLKPTESFAGELKLEGPRDLPLDPVMSVVAPAKYRHYWRARVLDNYDGTRWTSSFNNNIEFSSNMVITVQGFLSRTAITADFMLARGTDSLYASSGQPINSSIPAQFVVNGTGNNIFEVIQARFTVPVQGGSSFSSISSVSVAEVEKLRRATGSNPPWITGRYLQIPGNVPQRVRALAANITRNQNTAFDKAIAVEQWLRQNIKYDETIAAPPPGREGSEYLLFDLQRGYCTYYATAMIMMLRSQGIPARMVEGYAQGKLDFSDPNGDRATFSVLQRDRHAWVEVFFPQYGWVNFEPTATIAPIERINEPDTPQITPTPATNEPRNTPTPRPDEPLERPTPQNPTGPSAISLMGALATLGSFLLHVLPWVLGAMLLVMCSVFGLRYAELRGFNALDPVVRAYAVLSRWASWLGIGSTHTPYEQARELGKRAPRATSHTHTITNLYVKDQFGQQPTDPAKHEMTAQTALRQALKEFRTSWLWRITGIARIKNWMNLKHRQ